MTEDEDAHNGVLNEIIKACPHSVITRDAATGQIRCGHCPARFAVVLFPRKARPRPISEADLEEYE